ncbi:hypothetical protein Lalb_Chr03g0040451 [Lupinus albus]|uniref:Uncharacterized protein n=1 Tax=Lupinus albus TaxID=3870 RepID=A0A6A4QWF4_LUPAL|nr:hypothetical protein Lalb_Chr03g0040451 [Lupinus albus]
MGWSILCLKLLVSSFFLLTLFLNVVHANKKCYIAYLGVHSHGSTPSLIDLEIATYSHYDLVASILGRYQII